MATSAPVLLDEAQIRELAGAFKLLGDETRLRILFYLAQNNELHVTDLRSRLGQSQPMVSHHLALLKVAGLIESCREGRHNFYNISRDRFGEILEQLSLPPKLQFGGFTLSSE